MTAILPRATCVKKLYLSTQIRNLPPWLLLTVIMKKLCNIMKKSQLLPVRLDSLRISLVILCVIKPTYPASYGKFWHSILNHLQSVSSHPIGHLMNLKINNTVSKSISDGATDLIAATRCRARLEPLDTMHGFSNSHYVLSMAFHN